ncbi:hypothetical protein PAERUG_E16_London_17_VIM_2_04_14_00384 [Pseudomonas aeruginosa]|nr:hypothetical protein PAERUG_E16_London_17_VIM_2_04_14_00384 [Pseudomonas aeruginosa]
MGGFSQEHSMTPEIAIGLVTALGLSLIHI